MTNNLEKQKQRIMSMLAKAMDPAASKAEADACFAKAQKIMDECGLTEADCQAAKGDDFRFEERHAKVSQKHGVVYHPVDKWCGKIIASFCGCRRFFMEGKSVFFGLDNDVLLAGWMRDLLVEQYDAAWEHYKLVDRSNRSLAKLKDARISFTSGYCAAITERLEDWLYRTLPQSGTKEDRDAADSRNALTFVKQDLIVAELKRRGIVLVSATVHGKRALDGMAAGAGLMAGKAARLSQNLDSGPRQVLLGR